MSDGAGQTDDAGHAQHAQLDAGRRERYTAQLRLAGWGEQAQIKLTGLTVFVVGAGALGGAAAAYLAGAGVGRLAVVDGSQITIDEQPRQLLHFTPEVGMGKADSAAAKLSLLNPEVHVDPFPADLTAENAELILSDADVVLDCSSRLDVRRLVNDACIQLDTPFVSGATGGYDGAFMVVTPQQTACCRCVEDLGAEATSATDATNSADDVDSTVAEALPGFDLPARAAGGVYGPVTGAIGSLMAHAAIGLMLGVSDPGAGLLRRFAGASGEWTSKRPARRPDCSCSNGSAAGNV